MSSGEQRSIADVICKMEELLAPLQAADDPRSYFLGTYLRTTLAVERELAAGGFADPGWVDRWDVTFADLYLEALERWSTTGSAPGPWVEAFTAGASGPRLPPLRHVLLGMNAHINYDLPQALLAVISDDEFDRPEVLQRRQADHRRIDDILAARIADEDLELRKQERPGDRSVLDRLLTPLNQRASRRFLAEARAKVWRNTLALHQARGTGALEDRLAELEELSRRRVADLRRPGQVLLHLGWSGFGVVLGPVDGGAA